MLFSTLKGRCGCGFAAGCSLARRACLELVCAGGPSTSSACRTRTRSARASRRALTQPSRCERAAAAVWRKACGLTSRAAQAMSSEQRKAAEQQIFNLKEAFERLSRELGDLLRAPADGISVAAAENNVYVWDVCFTFPRTCQLGQVRLPLLLLQAAVPQRACTAASKRKMPCVFLSAAALSGTQLQSCCASGQSCRSGADVWPVLAGSGQAGRPGSTAAAALPAGPAPLLPGRAQAAAAAPAGQLLYGCACVLASVYACCHCVPCWCVLARCLQATEQLTCPSTRPASFKSDLRPGGCQEQSRQPCLACSPCSAEMIA